MQNINMNNGNTYQISRNFKRNDYYYNYSSSTKTQRLAKGAASFFTPGLGQVINGENSKGVAFFLANLLSALYFLRLKPSRLGFGISHLAIGGYAAYDAYKKG